MSAVSYMRPETLAEAIGWLQGKPATIAAGCTDLFALTQRQTLPGPILDITAIPDLCGIIQSEGCWQIGAATSWSAIAKASLPAAFDGLRQAAREVGSIQIQTSGTIGGNLCNASPAADGVPPLLTLDAQVEIAGPDGSRRMPLDGFIKGPRRTALGPGEILVAVHVPVEATQGRSAFLKLGARASLVISIAMVAVRIVAENGHIASAAISVGACSPVAILIPALETALVGCPVAEAPTIAAAFDFSGALSPIADVRADEGYRLHAAGELVSRAIATAIGSAMP